MKRANMARSNIIGTRPTKVVISVRKIARRRPRPASRTASIRRSPPARRWFTSSTSTRLAFTTTPESATMPITEYMVRS